MISLNRVIELSVWQYLALRNEYWSNIIHSVESYLSNLNDKVSMTNAKKTFKKAMKYAYTNAAKEAWVDGGGVLPVNKETKAYIKEKIDEEIGHINALFTKYKLDIKAGKVYDFWAEAQARADGYARSLDIVYNNVKIIHAGDEMLLFTGNDGQETCTDCMKHKGKWHKASWWRKNNAVPPNRDFECGGWKCAHYLADKTGKIYTL